MILVSTTIVVALFLYSQSQSASVQLFFDNDAYKPLVKLIERAKKEILVQMYSFTHKNLMKELEMAKQRGVDVRVIAEKQEDNDELFNARFPVRWEMSDKMFHRKLAVVDRHWIWLGSANWTYNGFEKNSEVNILISSFNEAQKIIARFEQDWQHCRERK